MAKLRLQPQTKKASAKSEPSEIWLVSVVQLATLFDVTERTITDWVTKRGCPRLAHGKYDLKAVFDWWMQSELAADRIDMASPEVKDIRVELWRAQAEEKRLKVDILKGKLVPKEDIAPIWTARTAEVASMLSALAKRLPPLLEGKDRYEMQQAVDQEVTRIKESFCREGRFCET